MTLALQRLKIEDIAPPEPSKPAPADTKCPPESVDAFKIHAVVENDIKNRVFDDLQALGVEDKKHARKALIKLFKNAENGPPLEKCFDAVQCHPIHEFHYQHTKIKIWRLWLSGVIRICFIYLPGNRIVVLSLFAKRQDKMTKSQKEELEGLATQLLNNEKQGALTTLEDKL
jgi:phage-related protein